MAEEYESLVAKNGLKIIDFGITWHRLFSDGTLKESALDHLIRNNANNIVSHKKWRLHAQITQLSKVI